MEKEPVENRIRAAFAEEAPNGPIPERVLAACDNAELESAESFFGSSEPEKVEKPPIIHVIMRYSAIAAAIALFFLAGILLGMQMKGGEYVSASDKLARVYIDVNPSVELEIDVTGRVVSCKAANDDAAAILGGMELAGVQTRTALNAIIGAMYMNGYLSAESNSILVSGVTDGKDFDTLLEEIVSEVNSILSSTNIECSIIAQDVKIDEILSEQANANHVSVGKMSLVNKIINTVDDYTDADATVLSAMSVKELNLIYASLSRNDGHHGEGEENNQEDGDYRDDIISGSPGGYVDETDAWRILLAHLGIKEGDMAKPRIIALLVKDESGARKLAYKIVIAQDYVDRVFYVDCISGELITVSDYSSLLPSSPDGGKGVSPGVDGGGEGFGGDKAPHGMPANGEQQREN